MSKLLLYICNYYPGQNGEGYRSFNQIKILKELGYKIILVSLFPSSVSALPVENYVDEVFIIEKSILPPKLNSFSFLFKNIKTFLHNTFYFKSDLITSFKLKKHIYIKLQDLLQKLKKYNFNFVICRTPSVCYYAEKINLKIFFDLKAKIVYDMVDSLSRFIHSLRQQDFYKKLKILSYFYINMEKHLKNYDYITYITLADAIHSGHKNSVFILPDIRKDFTSFKISKQRKIYDIILFGDWSYFPNKLGITWFLKEIYPFLREKNIKVIILGKGSENLKNIYKNEEIKFLGEVDTKNFKKFLLSSKISVSPVFIGAGYQNKVIDSLAFGIPTIAHKIFKNSDPLAPVLTFKDKKTLLKNIDTLLKDKNLYEDLCRKSKDYYLKLKKKSYKDNLFFFENL